MDTQQQDRRRNSYSASSHLWFTLWEGNVTELYYPTVDRPQLRDLQFLVTDGTTFFHEEKRDLTHAIQRIGDHTLGYHCVNSAPDDSYTLTKDIISDPHSPTLLMRVRLTVKEKRFYRI